MEERSCIFCQIANKKIPAKIVYEDNASLAILDINPRSKGMSLVLPKEHYENFDQKPDISSKVFQSALIVAEKIKLGLSPKSVSFSIIESEAVPHFHIRLYPVYENEIPLGEGQPIKVTEMELNVTAEKIRSTNVSVKFETERKREIEIEEKPTEKKERSEEEIEAIRRELNLG